MYMEILHGHESVH